MTIVSADNCGKNHVITKYSPRLICMKGRQRMLSQNQERPSLRLIHGEATEDSEANEAILDVDPIDIVTDAITQACGEKALLLVEHQPWGHTRPIPLIAVVASGVYLIDPLLYPDAKVRVHGDGLDLMVDGVLKPRIAMDMDANCDALLATIETGPMPEVNMTAVYCLLQSRFGFSPMAVDGVDIASLRGLIRMLKRKGDLDEHARERLHLDLARRLTRVSAQREPR